jgi:CheY-like chemotaxis protein/anti-sigma regulatory factor (Ser/Thr protein kinase)
MKLLRNTIPTTIEIDLNISDDCGIVLADGTQIHQVIMNLCTNAYQAMLENGGTWVVQLEETPIDGETATGEGLNEGQYARLIVGDSGPGIDEAVMARIFEPYYTTKEVGEGTGLGLATVLGIVNEHGGTVTVRSKSGEGSTFEVFFPIHVQSWNDNQSSSTEAKKAGIPGKGEHILFVDDEEPIVQISRTILEKAGYQPTALTSSVEALETFRAHPDRFEMVVTDQTMPQMTGLVLAKEILAIRPEIPIILCTGYSKTVNAKDALAAGIRDYLIKPVGSKDLTGKIHRALDEVKTSAGSSKEFQ